MWKWSVDCRALPTRWIAVIEHKAGQIAVVLLAIPDEARQMIVNDLPKGCLLRLSSPKDSGWPRHDGFAKSKPAKRMPAWPAGCNTPRNRGVCHGIIRLLLKTRRMSQIGTPRATHHLSRGSAPCREVSLLGCERRILHPWQDPNGARRSHHGERSCRPPTCLIRLPSPGAKEHRPQPLGREPARCRRCEE